MAPTVANRPAKIYAVIAHLTFAKHSDFVGEASFQLSHKQPAKECLRLAGTTASLVDIIQKDTGQKWGIKIVTVMQKISEI